MEFYLLAKIAFAVGVVEKCFLGFAGVATVGTLSRYYRDYKESIQEEQYLNTGNEQ